MNKRLISLSLAMALTLGITFNLDTVKVSATVNSNIDSNNVNNIMLAAANVSYTLDTRSSYEIKNTTSVNQIIKSNTSSAAIASYNIIKYDENNQWIEAQYSEISDIFLMPGEKVRINLSTGNTLAIGVPQDLTSATVKINTPVFQKITILDNETYNIKNTSDTDFSILTNADGSGTSSFNSITYDSKGEIITLFRNDFGKILTLSGESTRVGKSASGALDIYVPYEYKNNIVKETNPIFYSMNLVDNENYELINNTGKRISILNSGMPDATTGYDCIVYNSAGDITQALKNDWINLNVENSSKAKFSKGAIGTFTMYIPYEFKDTIKKSNTQVFKKDIVAIGGSYEINNTSSGNITVINTSDFSAGNFDVSIYNKDGSLVSNQTNYVGEIIIEKYQKAVVSNVKVSDITFYVPFDLTNNVVVKEDINKDGTVNIEDLTIISGAYNNSVGSTGYNVDYDLNADKIIDIYDIVILSSKIQS